MLFVVIVVVIEFFFLVDLFLLHFHFQAFNIANMAHAVERRGRLIVYDLNRTSHCLLVSNKSKRHIRDAFNCNY